MFKRWIWLLVAALFLMIGCAQAVPGDATTTPDAQATAAQAATVPPTAVPATATPVATAEPTATPAPSATPTSSLQTLRVALPEGLVPGGVSLSALLSAIDLSAQGYALAPAEAGDADLTLELVDGVQGVPDGAYLVGWRYYAAVAPFDTVADDADMADLQQRWATGAPGSLLVDAETAVALTALWGPGQPTIVAAADLSAALQADRTTLGIVPFEALDPTFKVLSLGELSLFDHALQPSDYPLALGLVLAGDQAATVGPQLAELLTGWENRDETKITRLIMTGVTAMSRLTAEKMELYGYDYPARIIGPELSAADITHVSNEVPFVDGCPVNTSEDNLTFCSKYEYWEALEDIGTDIVGLSGNHVNDFGYDGARESIQFYRDRGIPIYGSGLNVTEACAPIYVESNGNRLAFLAALAFDPSYAWATDDLPGTCYYYDHKDEFLASITELSNDPDVDMVLVELQYLETYQPYPTDQQVEEFREIRAAGADVMTGVQSHVPQAWEPYGLEDAGGSGIIVYGLGNLFFDQMWSWETRTELMARHTIYDGRLVNSEVLTAVLEDYAQPRWATADERAEILARIFDAAPAR